MFLLATLAAFQAAAPVPTAPPAPKPGQQTVIREVVITRGDGAKSAATSDEQHREIIVIREGKEGTASAANPDRSLRIVEMHPGRGGSERREVLILREPGAPGTRVTMLSCDDGAKVDSEATDKDGKKTRVMICAKGGSSNVSKVQQLREAAKRIEAHTNLSPETRARVALAINEAIAKLPANE